MSPRTSGTPPLKAREVFRQTVVIDDPEQRRQKLEALCGSDFQLRSKVQDLLTARESSTGGLLARAVGDGNYRGTDTKDEAEVGALPSSIATALELDHGLEIASPRVGQQIGSYRLLKQLGQGGMGTVFLARQTEPVVRDVAVKVIRSDVTSPGIIKRFEAERQILAMMSHPNIAQVFDAGTTPEGQPYFVMELVRGIPITKYCEQYAVGLEARLYLFIDLCRAIEHAHQKGAVHRDLKPANVLVSFLESEPLVKVIDFGVAKALSPNLNTETPVTHFSQLVGTPLYMAPEQLRMKAVDVDIRTDVYSLGVLLYELLAGQTAYCREQLAELGLARFLDVLESQPPQLPTVKNKRFGRQRELDWITVKAMQAEPQERYQSAEELANDLQRFLNQQQVTAGPPSRLYAATTWWRRNTSTLGVTSTIALLLILGVFSAWQISKMFSTQRANLETQTMALEWQETARLQQAVYAFRNANLDELRRISEFSPNDSFNLAETTDLQRGAFEKLLINVGKPPASAVFLNSQTFGPMAFSAEASRIIAAGTDGKLSIYDVEQDGKILPSSSFDIPSTPVDSIAISPDGKRAVTGGSEYIWFWDLERQKLSKKVFVADAGIQSLAWSPDGEYVAAGARYELTWVGDKEGEELFRVINNHRHESIAFAKDSQSIFIPTRKSIDEYDLQTGKRLREISNEPFENARTLCVGGSQDNWLIVGERYSEKVMVIDLDTAETLGTVNISGKYPQKLATFGDGKWLSILFPDRRVELIHLKEISPKLVTGERHLCFSTVDTSQEIPENAALSLLWLDSQSRFLVSGGGQLANIWSRNNLKPYFPVPPAEPFAVAFPRNNSEIFCLLPHDASIPFQPVIVNPQTESRRIVGVPIPFEVLAESQRNSSGMAAVCGKNLIYIMDCKTGSTLAKLDSPFEGEIGVDISADGQTLAASNEKRICVWRTNDAWKSHRQVGDFEITGNSNILLTEDGSRIIGNTSSGFCEISSITGEIAHLYENNPGFISSFCLNSTESILATAKGAKIELWDRRTGAKRAAFSGVSEATSMCFAPDDRTLVLGNRDGSIRAWHLPTEQMLGVLYQREAAIRIQGLQFFPNSTQIFAYALRRATVEPILLGQPPRRSPELIPAPATN